MSSWSLEIHDDGYIVIKGNVPLNEISKLIKKYCKDDWKVDMVRAQELEAAFVICKPELLKEFKKDAIAK